MADALHAGRRNEPSATYIFSGLQTAQLRRGLRGAASPPGSSRWRSIGLWRLLALGVSRRRRPSALDRFGAVLLVCAWPVVPPVRTYCALTGSRSGAKDLSPGQYIVSKDLRGTHRAKDGSATREGAVRSPQSGVRCGNGPVSFNRKSDNSGDDLGHGHASARGRGTIRAIVFERGGRNSRDKARDAL